MTALFIGIDLGTSGCRAYAIDEASNVIATSDATLPASVLKNKHITQNPQSWWQTCQYVLSDLLNKIDRNQVKAIAVDGTSGTVLLCEKNGMPLTDGYMYNDSACHEEAVLIKKIAPDESGAHGASSGLAKCLFLLKQTLLKQKSNGKITCLTQADWVAGNFLNRFDTSDENNALKLGYDPVKQEWPSWLGQLNCLQVLPKQVLQPGDISGQINTATADFFGLPHRTKIIAGTTDSIAAFVASGCENIGEAVTSLGSTLAIKLISDKPIFAPEYGVYSHRLGNKWLVGGASNSGGAVLKQFFSSDELKILSKEINPKTSSGLNYYPLPTIGERFPINDASKQTTLSPRPENDALFLHGMLEGIALIEKMAFDKLQQLGAPYPTQITTMGGGSQNDVWRMIREKISGVPIQKSPISEAAFGSALLAKSPFDSIK